MKKPRMPMLCTCKVAVQGWDIGPWQGGLWAWFWVQSKWGLGRGQGLSAKHADLLHYTTSCVQRFVSVCERWCGALVRYNLNPACLQAPRGPSTLPA